MNRNEAIEIFKGIVEFERLERENDPEHYGEYPPIYYAAEAAITILAELGRGAGGGNHIDALKAAYRKHTLDDDSIGWNQLSDIICNAICNEIGDKAFQKWLSEVSK